MNLVPVYVVRAFVPPTHLDGVLDGVLTVADLAHGRYDRCAWWLGSGTEQFRPLAGSHASSGTVDATSREPTVLLEFTIPRDPELARRVIEEGIVPRHPWEEPEVLLVEALELRTQS